ncbi:SDR family NAD(P)-dependent oxidoreductase [Candidatus Borrarchaeum sp.]|uniref:SDR family NAD(P)-dependent oxidoreductase n=1 Tax=Candidatus Borrarchaeum sp. TaxID=2846742 RepID=UPI00257CE652|nr:SDR family NAD(P)-dependent oxidoreductase [Candidatus Borrarchaeum sp.]
MSSSSKKVVVTGGAGFIGSHLVEELVNRGYDVFVYDNFSRGRRENLKNVEDKITIVNGDILEFDLLKDVIKDSQYVFHEVAVCANYCNAFPDASVSCNLQGTLNVIKASLEATVEKVMFSSSATVYGIPIYQPIDEQHPLNPITLYSISKLASEYYFRFFSQSGLKYIIFRNFTVYGIRQTSDEYYKPVIVEFFKKLLTRTKPVLFGDGSQSIDFVHVFDVVQANILGMESDIYNEVFNVGSQTSLSIKELLNLLKDITGIDIQPEYRKAQNIVQQRIANISKIREMLGYNPTVHIKDGIKDEVNYLSKRF